MEYYLCRAMEVARLSMDQLFQLQAHEKKDRRIVEFDPLSGETLKVNEKSTRCLMPYEIQEMFKLPTLKETWNIPSVETLQEQHNINLRKQFRERGMIPRGGDFNLTNTADIHDFDERVKHEINNSNLDFICHVGSSKRRLSDSI